LAGAFWSVWVCVVFLIRGFEAVIYEDGYKILLIHVVWTAIGLFFEIRRYRDRFQIGDIVSSKLFHDPFVITSIERCASGFTTHGIDVDGHGVALTLQSWDKTCTRIGRMSLEEMLTHDSEEVRVHALRCK